MKRSYGYSAYRGRSTGRRVLVALVVLLAFVLIAAVAAYFALQGHIYYGDDGRAHIDLPGKESPSPNPPAGGVVILTPPPEEDPVPTPQTALTLVELPAGQAVSPADVEDWGASGVLFEMKGANGYLTYVSSLPQAISMGTSGAVTAVNAALEETNGREGLYTVAKVSCFRDDRAPRMNNGLALRSYAGNWLDRAGVRWLNPAVAETRAYLAGICQELAALGFDEIWLDCAGYPIDGDLTNIRVGETYDPSDRTTPVETFYAQVAQALADYPEVKLGISCSSAVVTGEGDESGQTLDLLKEYAYRLYLPAPDSDKTAQAYREALADMAPPVFTTPMEEAVTALAGGTILQPPEG